MKGVVVQEAKPIRVCRGSAGLATQMPGQATTTSSLGKLMEKG